MAAETLVVVGTAKGLFCLRSTDKRQHFQIEGPVLAGEEVYATCIDRLGTCPRLLAGSVNMKCGPIVRHSADRGRTWTKRTGPPSPSRRCRRRPGPHVAVTPAGADQPGVLYAGVEPAAPFRSDDRGRRFALVRGCGTTPTAPSGIPAAAGCA